MKQTFLKRFFLAVLIFSFVFFVNGVFAEAPALFNIATTDTLVLSVALDSTTPSSQEILAGSINMEVAKFKLTVNNVSDINITHLAISVNKDSSESCDSFQNLKLYDGAAQIGSTVAALNTECTTDFSFSNFTLAKSASKTLALKLDISNFAKNGAKFSFQLSGGSISPDNTQWQGLPTTSNTMTISSTSPQIAILSPNGGEVWNVGEIHSILWNSSNIPSSDVIDIALINKDLSGESFAINLDRYTGSYSWTVPTGTTSGSYYIEVSSRNLNTNVITVFDRSDSLFTIASSTATTATINILFPNGGEVWNAGNNYSIKWESSDPYNTNSNFYEVVSLYKDGTLVKDISTYTGTIPEEMTGVVVESSWPSGDDYKIRISYPDLGVYDESDALFSVVAATTSPSITVLSPNGGESFTNNQIIPISAQIKSDKTGMIKIWFIDDHDGNIFNVGTTHIAPAKIDYLYTVNLNLPELRRMGYSVPNQSSFYRAVAEWRSDDGLEFAQDSSNNWFGIKTDSFSKEIVEINKTSRQLINKNTDAILAELKQLRDKVKEQRNEIKYLKSLLKGTEGVTANTENIINNFITYGVDENTKKLGEGERAAVMYSFKSAFNKLPETEEELNDAIKIANGRFPSATNDKAEKQAKEQFIKIYNRVADLNDSHDNAAVKVMAYGLRQKAENRNLNSEKTGINIFEGIFERVPQTTKEWNIMQAITYSGATRKDDADRDLLSDEAELKYGTDPGNPDSDGDGYQDGIELNYGYNLLGKGNYKKE